MIGERLAHYEITSELGRGGMGEVWRPSDTKLGREVAIKTLPEAFYQDGGALPGSSARQSSWRLSIIQTSRRSMDSGAISSSAARSEAESRSEKSWGWGPTTLMKVR
ncbi:MAG TPA: hypothetical protein VEK15_05120 [Vicinamibacteria bacterium]|nr:hypothetical protein [Vicinamibacteria bacterium]